MDAYTEDVGLLRDLGLATGGFGYDWTDLGTVSLFATTTINVEVAAQPAQFWRFTVTRPADTVDPEPDEVLVVSTGSGPLSDYWPSVVLIATNMLAVEKKGQADAVHD